MEISYYNFLTLPETAANPGDPTLMTNVNNI